jgi:diguanylate cyclase (GGDEF)-like protein
VRTSITNADVGAVMLQEGWEETIASKTAKIPTESGVGCLLQIHPLEVSGNLVELSEAQTAVGRDPNCGLSIPDGSVSRRHALVERIGDTYQVTDLGSTNGTCVNEKRVTSAELSPGDRVQFGSFIFKFLSTNHIEMQYHEAVYSMMTRDGLTGTLNKRSFLDIIGREFRRSASRNTPLSLILFDIDHFKLVNDTHGHMAGDEVLQEMGRRISEVIAEHDVFARYGGEEFAILLSGVPAEEAAELAERCRVAVEATPFKTSVQPLDITISAGVADMTRVPKKESESELVQVADEKLYEGKRGGRNRVCV